jgi:hypothetical protein
MANVVEKLERHLVMSVTPGIFVLGLTISLLVYLVGLGMKVVALQIRQGVHLPVSQASLAHCTEKQH